ncbi:hypothetical protein [Adlercreutzia sp. ZJ242]|uniref:hypothetical protein n=1 Tax=Adlercreutzia sp. ZJ242 TaxID=2709409 RepID=UPI0013ED4F55|nr:hypothetical protein [Adlercreutzia sp. ZJ242]
MMQVIVFFEHKMRELPALRRLRDELVRRGHAVNIYSIAFEWYDAYRRAKKNGIDVLLVPWCYRSEQFWRFSPFYEVNSNVKMINLHHEQITPKLTECVLMPRDEAACMYPYHFCWTEHFKQGLIDSGVSKERAFVVGNLRLESVCANEAARQELAEAYELDPSKKWILYAESRRIDDISISKIRYDFHELANVTVAECDRYFNRWKESLSKTISQIKALPDDFFASYEFIYRPHPGSTIDFDIGQHPKIISERPISDWLKCVDFFCTWQSTSAFEAEMYGLPVVFHESVPIPAEERMPGVSDYFSIEDIGAINDKVLESCMRKENVAPIFEKYIGRYSELTAASYADAIEAIASVDESLPIVPYSKYWIGKMIVSEAIIKAMKMLGLIRKLHWPHTASMMYEDIPFGDDKCKDLH